DAFLIHNRPIIRHVDDSIVRVMMDRDMIVRRARGYAPLPVTLKSPVPPILAVGAHLKNTIAVSVGANVFISQHIGDLETLQAFEAFHKVQASLCAMYEVQPRACACDLHPDYVSSQFAARSGLRVMPVEHHYAHVLACMAEHHLEEPVLGVSWDGTGYGTDHTIWGGEFLRLCGTCFERVANLRTLVLTGGDRAVKEPRRSALGLLFEVLGDDYLAMEDLLPLRALSPSAQSTLRTMLRKKVNTPRTSSAGRLFDGVAALAGFRQMVRFEGQAAMEMEFALDGIDTDERYDFNVSAAAGEGQALVLDWEPLLRG